MSEEQRGQLDPTDDPAWAVPQDPTADFQVPFNIWDALLMVGWSFFALQLAGAVGVLFGVLDPQVDAADQMVALMATQIVGQLLVLAGVVGWLRSRSAFSWRLFGPRRPRLAHVPIGIGLGLAGVLVVWWVSRIVDDMFGPFEPPEQFALTAASESVPLLVLATVSAVLLAPVVEEIVFRGMLFQSVRSMLGVWAALVLSALVFAFIHIEVLQVPPSIIGLIALGIWFAGALHRTGSLLVPIFAHATYNTVVIVVFVYVTPLLD